MPAWRAASPRELPSGTRARASIRREAAASRQRFASRRRSPALSSRRVTATVIVPSQDRTLPAEQTGCDRERLRPCGRVRNRGRWYHSPPGGPQQGGDPAVPVAAVRAREPHDLGGERLLVRPPPGRVALHGAVLAEDPARPPLGGPERLDGPADRGPAAPGADRFPRPASRRISLSRVRSATALRSRAFSRSSSFRRRARGTDMPAYSWRQR